MHSDPGFQICNNNKVLHAKIFVFAHLGVLHLGVGHLG